MARYSTSLASKIITGTATIVTPDSGAFTALTGTAPYTVTLPDPRLYPGVNQTFFNGATGTVTLSTPSGNFNGTGGSGTSSVSIFVGNVVSATSDGVNYVVISEDGSALVATSGAFSGNVDMNGGGATVTISPNALIVNPATASSVNNVNIGASTRGSGAFTSLTANAATTLTANTTSTGTSSGTLVVTGGVGVSGAVNAGSVSASTITGTLQTAAQTNITSVGTLSSLAVSGALTAGSFTVPTAAQPNITSLGTLTSLSVSGTLRGGRVTLRDDSIENHANDTDTDGIAVNYFGFNSGNTRFRNFSVYNGRESLALRVIGSTGHIAVSNNLGIGTNTPVSRIQVGTNTFDGTNGMFTNSRVGISNHGNLTGLMLASTYNDANFPEYGLVFVQGPTTANYNAWSISPDGPAKGNRLNFIYQSNSSNIHTTSPRVVFSGNGNVGIGTSDPSNPLDVNGIARIRTGLHVNNWVEVEVTGSYAANTWYNTGISRGSVGSGGIYLLNVWADTYFTGQSYQESYTGIFVLPNRGSNSTVADTITLHRAGHAPNSETFQFRTLRTPGATDSDIYLQWLSNFALTGLNATAGRQLRIGIVRLAQPINNA
jgi:hypothetical protein